MNYLDHFKALQSAPILGNSEHPVKRLLKKFGLSPVPKFPEYYWVELTDGRVVTYRQADRSFQLMEYGLEEFKRRCNADEAWDLDPLQESVLPTDKHLGNALLRLLSRTDISLNGISDLLTERDLQVEKLLTRISQLEEISSQELETGFENLKNIIDLCEKVDQKITEVMNYVK